jgi:hypothetical protein
MWKLYYGENESDIYCAFFIEHNTYLASNAASDSIAKIKDKLFKNGEYYTSTQYDFHLARTVITIRPKVLDYDEAISLLEVINEEYRQLGGKWGGDSYFGDRPMVGDTLSAHLFNNIMAEYLSKHGLPKGALIQRMEMEQKEKERQESFS